MKTVWELSKGIPGRGRRPRENGPWERKQVKGVEESVG